MVFKLSRAKFSLSVVKVASVVCTCMQLLRKTRENEFHVIRRCLLL